MANFQLPIEVGHERFLIGNRQLEIDNQMRRRF